MLPISNCTRAVEPKGSASKFRFLDTKYDLSRGLDRIANRTGLRSDVLVMGTLLSWCMRPQPELRTAVEWYGASLGFRADSGARHRHIALHMRRGDKYSLHARHMGDHTWRAAPESFVTWGRRFAADIGAERVLFMTDDAKVDLANISGDLLRAPAPRDCLPSFIAAAAVRAGKGSAHTSAAKGLHTISNHPELLAKHLSGRESELERKCGPPILMDEGIQLLAGIFLMAQCAAFVGTQISNVGSLVVELMATQRHPPIFRDILNDAHRVFLSDERVWFGGVHNPKSIRPVHVERLMQTNGLATHGAWME
jgi:hypothetical protein